MPRHGLLWACLLLACANGATDRFGGPGATDGAASSAGNDDDDADDAVPTEFGDEEEFELRLNDEVAPPLMLAMNRDEVAELFGDKASEVLLLELDSTALLTNTLETIKNACGTSWQLDAENPGHDCSQTQLGSSFVGPDGNWETSAEYALVRILTMTPANVVVDGTSSNAMQNVADFLDIGDGYSQILSDALGIPRTVSVVSTESLVQAFQENFVATHPEVGEDATLAVYLSDALSDLETMTERLGPSGDHPGVVDPSQPIHGKVFGDDFEMRAQTRSNLRLVDGIDGNGGKGFVNVVVDQTGPTYEDEIEFDFTDPAKFSLSGLEENLTVDIKFRISEEPKFVNSCLEDPPCQNNLPGTPADASSVWALDPWSLEYAIAYGAYLDYQDRVYHESYLLGTASIDIGQDGNPPGWVEYNVPIIGPDEQYVWETVLEVAQVALHETPYNTFSEGQTDVAFTLRDVPIGLTGAQAAEAVRPHLQAQASQLSDFLLGDYKKNNDPVDFYYQRGDDGEPYLFFVHESDLREDLSYGYDDPGFFLDPALSERASRKDMTGVGDTVHEKLAIEPGEQTVYFRDDEGTTYRLRIVRPDDGGTDLSVFVSEGIP